jgi:hypothetical protein
VAHRFDLLTVLDRVLEELSHHVVFRLLAPAGGAAELGVVL